MELIKRIIGSLLIFAGSLIESYPPRPRLEKVKVEIPKIEIKIPKPVEIQKPKILKEVSGIDFRKYTIDHLIGELSMAEIHAKEAESMPKEFCIDCLLKHTYNIWKYSEEMIGFAKDEEERKLAEYTYSKAYDMIQRLKIGSIPKPDEYRELRKIWYSRATDIFEKVGEKLEEKAAKQNN